MKFHFYITILAALLLSLPAYGQKRINQPDTLSVVIFFHQGRAEVDPGYHDNGEKLIRFANNVNEIVRDPDIVVLSVEVSSGVSPEGPVDINTGLVRKRLEAIRDFLCRTYLVYGIAVTNRVTGVDWLDFIERVENITDPDFIWKDGVAGAMEGWKNKDDAHIQNALKSVGGGKAWEWLMDNVFPEMRYATCSLRCRKRETLPQGCGAARNDHPRDTIVIREEVVHRDTVWLAEPPAEKEQPERRIQCAGKKAKRDSILVRPLFALRTNLLIPAMNVGVEIPLGNRFSISGDFYSPWLLRSTVNSRFPAQSMCLQLQSAYVDLQYWFGKRHRPGWQNAKYRLTGHSFGIVATAGQYDFEYDWKGRQGEFAAIGLSYTYAVNVGRNNAMHIELDTACGYMYRQHKPYNVRYAGGELIHKRGEFYSGSTFMPFRIGVNLAVPIRMKLSHERIEKDGTL